MRPTNPVEEILGTRARVAVLRVLRGVDVPLNASQIAARTRLTRPAVAAALRDLASMGIVRSSSAGRANVHSLAPENIYVREIIEPAFSGEEQVPGAIVDDLRDAFAGLSESVVLFGSYARGDQAAASDVDVVLVAADSVSKAELEHAASDHAAAFRARFGASLAPLVYSMPEAAALPTTAPVLAAELERDAIVVSGLPPWRWGEVG